MRVVACTAVDDPPPKLDDWRKLAGDMDGSCQAPDPTLRPGGYPMASLHAVNPEGQERSRMRCMELTEALVTEDITPFERERLREALEEEVRRQLPADSQLLRVVDWDPAGGHAVENAPGMRKYRVAYETEPRD